MIADGCAPLEGCCWSWYSDCSCLSWLISFSSLVGIWLAPVSLDTVKLFSSPCPASSRALVWFTFLPPSASSDVVVFVPKIKLWLFEPVSVNDSCSAWKCSLLLLEASSSFGSFTSLVTLSSDFVWFNLTIFTRPWYTGFPASSWMRTLVEAGSWPVSFISLLPGVLFCKDK